MAEDLNFIQALNQKIANDPNLQQSMIQFGANISKPYDQRLANPASQAMGALQGSMEYLNGLRAQDTQAALRERAMKTTEGQLEVAQRGAAVGEQRANTEQKGSEEGTIPLQQAQAEALRKKYQLEKLKLDFEKNVHGQKPDSKLLDVAIKIATNDGMREFGSDKERLDAIFDVWNTMSAAGYMPPIARLLKDIPDETILAAITTPDAEQRFITHYGPAGASRLAAARKKAAMTAPAAPPGTKPQQPKAPTDGKVTVPFKFPKPSYGTVEDDDSEYDN